MKQRKTLITLLTAGAFVAGLGAGVLPAAAELRTLTVTLLGGSTVHVTVDVPPGTPLDQIKLPALNLPVIGVSDSGPQPGTGGGTTPPVQVGVGGGDKPPSGGGNNGGGSNSGGDKGTSGSGKSTAPKPTKQQKQTTTGHVKKSAPKVETLAPGSKIRSKKHRSRKRQADGQPTPADPTFSFSEPGPAPIGVPNFFIEKFQIPPFLLPIYQAAGIQYGVPWQVLAAINEIETDYGRNLSVSTAGAVGWMQFLPSTFKQYGVDANADGRKDPYNPVDAIFSAARYLRAAGADKSVKKAIFAYNHADWYVQSVLLRAKLIGGLPADLIGSLTGLTQGHFPVHARARYADDLSAADAQKRVKKGKNAAIPIAGAAKRRSIDIYAKKGSPVIAVQDGRVVKIGKSKSIGRYLVLQDAYGNRYTYGNLGKVAPSYPVPKAQKETKAQISKELKLKVDPKPTRAASAGRQKVAKVAKNVKGKKVATKAAGKTKNLVTKALAPAAPVKERLFAHPARKHALAAGGDQQVLQTGKPVAGYTTFSSYFSKVFGLDKKDVVLKKLKPGSQVVAGTVLGRIGASTAKQASHISFQIRPAGRGAPKIDPKPILDGWKLLESTAVYRAAGKNPFFGPDSKSPSIGQILLMSKEALQQRVLQDPRIEIYSCGQRDIRSGQIDRRVLATMEFLATSGLKPTITSLHCGHSYLTTSGNVSEHSTGDAMDVAKVNGIPILGHQGPGSITDITIRRLLTLQGTMKPHQIISLMTFKGTDNTLALADHNDHIHVGFHPLYGTNGKLGKQLDAALKPSQWIKLIGRLDQIQNPSVPTKPSKYSIKVKRGHSGD